MLGSLHGLVPRDVIDIRVLNYIIENGMVFAFSPVVS